MADVRAPLDEATLRESRDALLKAVQDQRRDIGVPVPDSRTAEEFIDPILRRVEVEHERDRTRDLVRPEAKKPTPPQPQVQIDKDGGRWMGTPGHSPRLPDDCTTFSRETGTAHVRTDGSSYYVPTGGVPGAAPGLKPATAISATVRLMKDLLKRPSWRERITKVFTANMPDEWKEGQYRSILADAVRVFGDPRRPTERRIIVG